MPNSDIEIGNEAFKGCDKLTISCSDKESDESRDIDWGFDELFDELSL